MIIRTRKYSQLTIVSENSLRASTGSLPRAYRLHVQGPLQAAWLGAPTGCKARALYILHCQGPRGSTGCMSRGPPQAAWLGALRMYRLHGPYRLHGQGPLQYAWLGAFLHGYGGPIGCKAIQNGQGPLDSMAWALYRLNGQGPSRLHGQGEP